MKKKKENICYFTCPFFGTSTDGMECRHPYWSNKGAYANMIIAQNNSRNGNVPEKCPLKKKK